MRGVYFTKEISKLKIDSLPENTLVVVHEMYDKPNIDRKTVNWQEFKITYSNYEVEQFVIVGLNRMINPSNRCDMVNDYLQVMTKNIPKISIDTSPFIGEPWRVWFHYSIAFGEWMNIDYSYPIEGEWKKWFYYDVNQCPISGDLLPIHVKDTVTTLPKLQTKFEFYTLNDSQMEYYEEAKKLIFDKYGTPKMLTNNLLKMINKHLQLNIKFDDYLSGKKILIPDIGVYRYVAEEIKRRKEIYNCFGI